MKLFLAVGSAKKYIDVLVSNNTRNVLFSYQYIKDLDIFTKYSGGWLPENLLLDSGAFSVWTGKTKISIDDYIYFCQDTIEKLKGTNTNAHFVNLDVLPGKFGTRPTDEEREESARKGLENFEYILSQGVKTVPVFHQHEDFKWLEKMMTLTDYIGLSPANDVSSKEKNAWLRKAFSVTRDKVRTHGFGITSLNSLLEFPFATADSSSWTMGPRFARVPLFDEKTSKFTSIPLNDKTQLDKLWGSMYEKNIDVLSDYTRWIDIGCKAYMKANDFINRVWEKRNITFNK